MRKQYSFVACYLIMIGLAIVLSGVASIHAATLPEQANVTVNIGINYGTGPIEWHNNTAVPRSDSLMNATMRVRLLVNDVLALGFNWRLATSRNP